MEKVINFLEKYVQWLALALGGAYVLWAAYAYLYVPPLTAKVGSPPVEVPPGQIDPRILDTSVDKLSKAIKKPDISVPKVQDVLKIVMNGIGENGVTVVALRGFEDDRHQPFGVGIPEPTGPKVVIFDQLPNPPAAVPDKATTRWTVIEIPTPGAAPAPAAGQPAGAAGQAPAAPVMIRQDVAYCSMSFKVDQAKLAEEINRVFNGPNVPPGLLVPEFVRVELLREERKPDGTWGAPTIIKTLPIWDIMPHPAEQKPALSGDALKKALYAYHDWLEANQDVIIHPAFYQTAADAEIWVAPGAAPPEVVAQPGQVVAERPFDPSRDNPKTPEQIQQKQAYQEAQRMMRRGPGGRPGPGGAPGGYGGPPTSGIQGGRPNIPYIRPPTGIPPAVNNGVPPAFINPVIGGQPNVNGGLPGQAPDILVHDITIQEGKTYRYAVRYKLFNPMFDKNQLATKAVYEKFDVDSPDPSNPKTFVNVIDPKTNDPAKLAELAEKMWTPSITVEPLSHIFVTRVQPFTNQADFVIYTWKDGHWKETTVKKLTPGDAVNLGKSTTPWTVVDVRKDLHGDAYVILMDEHGILIRRDEASDAQSPEWQKLKTEAGAAAVAR